MGRLLLTEACNGNVESREACEHEACGVEGCCYDSGSKLFKSSGVGMKSRKILECCKMILRRLNMRGAKCRCLVEVVVVILFVGY